MARLTEANLRAFDEHVSRVADAEFAARVLTDPFGREHSAFVEQLQHLSANYFLSAVPLLEHLRLYVNTHYADETDRTRTQYQMGLGQSVQSYDGHAVVVQLRHMVVHRQLPTIRLVPSPHSEQPVAPIINRNQLLEDERCNQSVRALLGSLPNDEISLDGLIRDDGRLVIEFVDWFFRIQSMHHLEELSPIWRLLERRERLVDSLASN